ncbi:hypothetical protein AWR36_008490 [Microbulbifer flavimaris]|uniref:DUF4239 domain-containing protein n=1 Tax=Microbulbifer flavimaris TaxID=1781068 RepID=A0ABX4I0T6_9GAMM|nr:MULTISPECIES: hypothetical protein [Microbulbifer]KUJ83843.1 hypothetical protein AVO43_08460 [Microbulbifer sp. ZGT114]PCO06020.1 hypothetical protein AWR36_008490 [Microbulbifer flavimaris]
MNLSDPFSTLHLGGLYLLSILLVIATLGFGFFLGRRARRKGRAPRDTSVGSAVAATLGLLAFMLAFTFNMTAERFAQRKALLLEEVNTIATAYLRADFLSKSGERQARALLAEYAAARDFNPLLIELPEYLRSIERSTQIHEELWDIVSVHVDEGFDPEKLKAFYEPLNGVIDYHTRRVEVGGRYQIPPPIWMALYAITGLSMFGIGFQLGVARGGSPQVALALALSFSLVILLIADLDRAGEGFLTVDNSAMAELSASLQQRQLEAKKSQE